MLEGIAGLAIGLMVGATAVWLWLDSKASDPESVETLKRENELFREEVNEHFVQTAELINQLTDSYKAVFDHLSDGAEKLVDEKAIRERMPQVTDEEIRLKRLGAPREAAAATPAEEVNVTPEEAGVSPEEPGEKQNEASATQEEVGDSHETAESSAEETEAVREQAAATGEETDAASKKAQSAGEDSASEDSGGEEAAATGDETEATRKEKDAAGEERSTPRQ